MNDNWHSFLNQKGANIEAGSCLHFGNPHEELKKSENSPVIADLSHIGVIEVQGEDAATFLHNQLTNDLKALTPGQSQLSGYCSPKGRLLALFRVIALDEGYLLTLPAEILPQTLKRLRMFVLMSKVTLNDISDDQVRIGLSGTDADTLLQRHWGDIPETENQLIQRDDLTVLRLPGLTPRFQIMGSEMAMEKLWNALADSAQPVGAGVWELLDIEAGIPVIHKETVEAFVPQMVNLQAVGGLSFTKGCYPGQEVVARMQYLGKLKRRMYIAHTDTDSPPTPGEAIVTSSDSGEAQRKIGEVVAAQPAPQGGTTLTAVIEINAADTATLHLGSLNGPSLALLPLPYSLE